MRFPDSLSLTVIYAPSAALNFMVYLQNALSTSNQSRPKFPRLKPDSIGLVDEQRFRERFVTAWEETIALLETHGTDKFPYEGYDKIFRGFFVSEEAYQDCYLMFNCWWVSGGGSHLVNSVENTRAIYDFAVTQSGKKDMILRVQFVFDDVQLTNNIVRQGIIILSIPEVEILHYTGELTDEIKEKIKKAVC